MAQNIQNTHFEENNKSYSKSNNKIDSIEIYDKEYEEYEDLYDFDLNNFKSKSGTTHRDNKQNSKKKSKNMSIYSSKHVRIQQNKQTNFMKSIKTIKK